MFYEQNIRFVLRFQSLCGLHENNNNHRQCVRTKRNTNKYKKRNGENGKGDTGK